MCVCLKLKTSVGPELAVVAVLLLPTAIDHALRPVPCGHDHAAGAL